MEDNTLSNSTWTTLETTPRYYPSRLQVLFRELIYECYQLMMKTPNISPGNTFVTAFIIFCLIYVLMCYVHVKYYLYCTVSVSYKMSIWIIFLNFLQLYMNKDIGIVFLLKRIIYALLRSQRIYTKYIFTFRFDGFNC